MRSASLPSSIFERLADVAAERERDADSRITAILELIADGLDLGLTFLARADEETLHIERVCDRAGMGLHAGAEIPLRDTFCRVLLSSEDDTLLVEDTLADARFAGLATTRDLGIGAYTGVSLQRADGTTYGTLCTLHPQPRTLRDGEMSLLRLAGRLVMQAVEATALREQEARYRALAEHGADLVCILAPDGTARYGSPSYTHVLGAPVEELHRRAGSPLGVIHPDDRARVQEAMRACVRDGCPTVTLTCRHRHADGSYHTLEAIAVNRLSDPTIRGIIITSRDVTARVQAEERLRALTEAATDAIVAADAVGRILSWNAAAAHLFGYTAAEAIGQPLTLLIPERYHDAHERGLRRVSAGGDARLLGSTVALVARRKDGTEFPCELSLSSWETDDGRCYSAIIRDVSARVRAEAALRQSEERLRALVRNAPLVLSEVDAEGVFTFSAGRGLDAMGLPQHASVGHSAFDLYRDQPALLEGLRRVLAGEDATVAVTLRGVPFEAFYTSQRDAAGRVTGAIAVAVDVSARARAEEALHQSEEQFRLYFEHAALGMAVFGLDGRFLRVNAAFCAMMGYSAEDLLALRVQDLDAPDGVEATEARLRQIREGARDSFQFERRYRQRDGREVWIEVNATLVRDAQGHPLYIVNQMQDITARKDAEAALRQSEERFRLLFDEAPTGMALAAPDGHLIAVNPALCQMLGYAKQDLLAQGTPLLTHPDDIPASRALIADLLAGESQGGTLEKRYLHRDGHIVWTAYTATLLRDDAGQPLYFIFHLHDISARKQAEEVRARLLAIAEASDDAIFGETLDGLVTAWNAGAERLYGYSPAEMVGQSVARLIPPERPDELAALMGAVARGETIRQYETERVRQDGTRIAVALTIAPIRDDTGCIRSASVVARDITARRAAEAALRAAEELLRAVYGAMSCGVLVLDAAGEVVEVNAAGQEIIGLDSTAIREHLSANQHVAEMLREDGSPMPPQERPSYRALVTGVPARDVVMGFRRLDGGERWVQMDAVPLLDNTGVLRHVVVSFTDITGRRSAEETLRREMERRAAIIAVQQEVAAAVLDLEAVLGHITTQAQALTGASGAVVEMIDGEEMVYRAASGSAAAHVGLRLTRAGSLSGLCTSTGTVLRCDDAETDERVDRAWRVGVRSMILVPLRQSERIVGVLKVLSPRPNTFGGDDAETLQVVAGVLGAALGQADAFAAVRASEDHLRQLLQNAPIGACVIDEHGVFESVNRQYAVMLGYTPAELIGQHSAMVIPPQERAGVMAGYATRLNGRESGQRDFRFLTKERALKTALAGTVQITGLDGRPRRASFVVDITARKQTEEALQASNRELARSNAELEQFTRVASHDLRSPLSSIGGFAQLLHLRYKGRLDAHADEYLDFITSGVARMQALIDALLSYARLDSRAAPFAPVDTAALVRDALANLRATIEDTGATVEVGDLPTVMGDATQLGQLLQNLIANALKFRRPDVTPLVRVWAERDDREGGAWVFAVRDNGIGLDPAQAARIFAIFGRLHTPQEYEGTGIGLAVCQKIVERHGGRIWVDAKPGQGATFRFTLPATGA